MIQRADKRRIYKLEFKIEKKEKIQNTLFNFSVSKVSNMLMDTEF